MVLRSLGATAALITWCLATSAAAGSIEGRVVRIVDGDTLDVLDAANVTHRIRLHGVDAPEAGQPFAKRARDATRDLAHQRQVIVITNDQPDRYGRSVGRVMIDGRDLGLQLLDAGLVWQFVRYDSSRPYRDAEQAARRARRGLWADPDPIAPWEWRRMPKAERQAHQQAAPSSSR